jgi:hypothetical protein
VQFLPPTFNGDILFELPPVDTSGPFHMMHGIRVVILGIQRLTGGRNGRVGGRNGRAGGWACLPLRRVQTGRACVKKKFTVPNLLY